MPLGNVSSDKVSSIKYAPDPFSANNDLLSEKTITATAEPSVDDDSVTFTLPAPTDSRLAILNLVSRFMVGIHSVDGVPQWLGGVGHYYVRAYVDQINAGHLLFDWDLTSDLGSTPHYACEEINASNHPTVFALLKNGQAHILHVRSWVDTGSVVTQNGNVELAVGTASTETTAVLGIQHTGWLLLKGSVVESPDYSLPYVFSVADALTLNSLDLQFRSEPMSEEYILSIVGTNHVPGLLSPGTVYLCHEVQGFDSTNFAYLASLGVLMWGIG